MKVLLRKLTLPLLVLIPVLFLVPSVAFAGGFNALQEILWFLATAVFGKMMGLAGYFLNYSIESFVIGFGDIYTTGGVGAAVDLVWVSVRDIFNITFIFGLVYIGFKMILNSDDSNTRRWLINLIIAALLVNFSLFFTKFIVDISNILATQIVTSGFTPTAAGVFDISGTFMNNMGINSVMGDPSKTITGGGAYGYIFGAMILFIIAMFVFGAGAILLTIRFAVLLIYMILSPLMFIGWVFPQLQRYTSQYWSGFLGRAFFAPIYILMLFLSSTVLEKYFGGNQAFSGTSKFETLFTGDGTQVASTFGGTLPPFVVACVFLVASLIIANKMGAQGASAAIGAGKSMGRKFRRGAGRMAKGTALAASYPVREPVRRGSYALGRGLNKKLDKLQASKNSTVSSIAGLNLIDRGVRSATKGLKDAKVGSKHTIDEDKLYRKNTTDRSNETSKIQDAETKIADATSSAVDLGDAFKDLSTTVSRMSKERLSEMGIKKLTSEAIAMNLTEKQLISLSESGQYSSAEIGQIRAVREAAINKTITNGSIVDTSINQNAADINFQNNQREQVFKGSVNDIGNLPTSVFTNIQSYDQLSPAMLEARIKNGVSDSEKIAMRTALEGHLGIPPGTKPSMISGLSDNMWTKWETGNSVHAAKFFT